MAGKAGSMFFWNCTREMFWGIALLLLAARVFGLALPCRVFGIVFQLCGILTTLMWHARLGRSFFGIALENVLGDSASAIGHGFAARVFGLRPKMCRRPTRKYFTKGERKTSGTYPV